MRKEILAIISVAAISLAGTAQANLLKNGDFESVDGRVGLVNGNELNDLGGSGGWDIYESLPRDSWTTTSGPGIEIQYDGTVVSAHSGNHYVELDSHGYKEYKGQPASNSAMEQSFVVDTEMEYYLSLWYQPRTDHVDDNRISIYLNDSGGEGVFEDPSTLNGQSSTTPDWREYRFSLGTLASGKYTLGLEALDKENTLGGFVDDIAVNPVPEPATMLLFGTGLAALAGFRTRRKK